MGCHLLRAWAQAEGLPLRLGQRRRLCRPPCAGHLTAALAAANPADSWAGLADERLGTAVFAQGWRKAEAWKRSLAQRLAEADRPPSPPDEERLDCFRCGLCRVCRLDAPCGNPSPHRHAKTCSLDCCRVLCCVVCIAACP